MNKTDEILDRLKGWQPVIDDPDELTECIMRSLPDRETGNRRWRLIGGRALIYAASIAAVLLVGFFLYQNKPEEQPFVAEQLEEQEVPQPEPLNVEEENATGDVEKDNVLSSQTLHVMNANITRNDREHNVPRSQTSQQALAEKPQPAAENVVLTNAADSLYYYLTLLENQMGDCRDSTCLAELTGLMQADERIKGLVNKIIHKQVETAYKEEYLVDTITRYVPL